MRLMIAVVVLLSAAAPLGAQDVPACLDPRTPVPDPLPRALLISPADSAALSSMANQLWTSDRMSGPYPRNVVNVSFVRGTPAVQVQAAVDRVCGEVIGPGAFGVLVRIATDGTHDALWAAVDALAALPQVEIAGPDLIVLVPFSPFTTMGGGQAQSP
jgi:hypothetical protein